MSPDEENLIKKLKDEAKQKKEEHQARVDKMLARMAEMHEQIAEQQKTINEVRANLERAIRHANKLEEDIRTYRTNKDVSVDEFVEKLRELEELLLEGKGDDTVLAAIRFLRKIRGVS